MALIPLALVLGEVTEDLAIRFGDVIGGLLNATFGNVVELILSIAALTKGLYTVVAMSSSAPYCPTCSLSWVRPRSLLVSCEPGPCMTSCICSAHCSWPTSLSSTWACSGYSPALR